MAGQTGEWGGSGQQVPAGEPRVGRGGAGSQVPAWTWSVGREGQEKQELWGAGYREGEGWGRQAAGTCWARSERLSPWGKQGGLGEAGRVWGSRYLLGPGRAEWGGGSVGTCSYIAWGQEHFLLPRERLQTGVKWLVINSPELAQSQRPWCCCKAGEGGPRAPSDAPAQRSCYGAGSDFSTPEAPPPRAPGSPCSGGTWPCAAGCCRQPSRHRAAPCNPAPWQRAPAQHQRAAPQRRSPSALGTVGNTQGKSGPARRAPSSSPAPALGLNPQLPPGRPLAAQTPPPPLTSPLPEVQPLVEDPGDGSLAHDLRRRRRESLSL